jgi:septum formation protein
MIHQPLTLASESPRRRDLLASLGLDFRILIPDVDETTLPGEKPAVFAERLAVEKAGAVSAEGLIIAADTVVVHENTILGKPADPAQAWNMLTSLSGAVHEVVTGVCIRDERRSVVFSVGTEVVFRHLKEMEIDAYIATGEPLDKAGAYAIQGGAAHMVRSIRGSYTNVVGLPLCEVYEALISF